jgi:hypothetical protein
LETDLPTRIQAMEKSQEYHPGFAKEDAMRIIIDTDPLAKINGEGVGLHPGYRKNGKGLNSLQCEEVADPSDQVDHLGMEVKVAASLAVVI